MLNPRENLELFGHADECEFFLKSFHSPRFNHAWIFSGPVGVGKETFAFHMARYILSKREDFNTRFEEKEPLHRRIVARSHGDLWSLPEDVGAEIGVDKIRDLNQFLTKTTSEGGWRVVIIDRAERLNRNAANALLKNLEEPPASTVFFLITDRPSCLLPTIRSRCQILGFSPLGEKDVEAVLKAQSVQARADLPFEKGCPGQLSLFLNEGGEELYTQLLSLLRGGDVMKFVQAYGDKGDSYALTERLLRAFLHTQLLNKLEGGESFFKEISIEQATATYDKVERLFSECREGQLDQKAALASVLLRLQEKV